MYRRTLPKVMPVCTGLVFERLDYSAVETFDQAVEKFNTLRKSILI